MGEDFDISQVPYYWTYCFLSDCPRREACMRYQAGLRVPEEKTELQCVLPRVLQMEKCPQYLPIRKVRTAYGFTNIFREVKEKDLKAMKKELASYLGCKSTFYNYRKGERPITPQQQEWISEMFRRYGYTGELQYDKYKETYVFS